jgi:hypothetical protein
MRKGGLAFVGVFNLEEARAIRDEWTKAVEQLENRRTLS